jgi:hypothetical protein
VCELNRARPAADLTGQSVFAAITAGAPMALQTAPSGADPGEVAQIDSLDGAHKRHEALARSRSLVELMYPRMFASAFGPSCRKRGVNNGTPMAAAPMQGGLSPGAEG